MSAEGPLPGLLVTVFSLCPHMAESGERGSKTHHVSSCKGANSIPKGPTLVIYLPPKGSTSKYHHIHMMVFIT